MKEEKFRKQEILRIGKSVLKKKVCDNCLGRQLAQISTGMTNKERGQIIRKLLKIKKAAKENKCSVCDNLFRNLEKYVKKAVQETKGVEFNTFVLGTKLSSDIIQKEEALWEDTGINFCEPIKSEINRELGKLIEKKIKKNVDEKNPDVLLLFDLEKKEIEININPLFISGKYKKLVRGIPQTKWDKYKETVEDIMAKVIMKHSRGSKHSLHCAGREDINARCLDGRPFVFEVSQPIRRSLNLKNITREINKSKKVHVSSLAMTDRKQVSKIKELRPDKTYRVVVSFETPPKELKSLKKLVGYINQKTPLRVLHRRADKLRKRRVKNIKWKILNDKKVEFEIRGEAGLYIKELVSGDDGRTKPSISETLKNKASVETLDVIKIHLK